MIQKPWIVRKENKLWAMVNPIPWARWIDDEFDHENMKRWATWEKTKQKNKVPFYNVKIRKVLKWILHKGCTLMMGKGCI
jgi:hypothetical protein